MQKRPASFAQDFFVTVQLDLLHDMHALVFKLVGYDSAKIA